MRKSPSIGHNLLLSQVLVAVSSIILVGALWLNSENTHFQKEVRGLRDNHLAAQRALIRGEVEKVADYIQYQKEQVPKRLEHSIKDRVYEANAIAKNIYDQNVEGKAPADIQKMIKDALRPIRFNEGRGYYFIINLNGIEELFADRPEMEGKNMLAVPGSLEAKVVGDMIALVRSSGEAFYEYSWTKPHMEGANHCKIAFVKLFEPYNWLIGTGEYLDDVEKDIQQETVSRIEQISFGKSGYIFATTWDGIGVAGPGKYSNTIDIVDANGLKIVQKMIDISRNGGGYLEYIMPDIDGKRSAHKLSYVMGIDNWRWYIGAGIYADEIQESIEDLKNDTIRDVKEFAFKILSILFGVTFLAYIVSRLITRKTRSNISALISYFSQVSVELRPIEPDLMKYAEFQELAGSVNYMVVARKQMEEALRDSEATLKSIFRVAPIGIGLVVDRVLEQVNQRLCDMLGYSREELLNKSARVLYPTQEEFEWVGREKYRQIQEFGTGTVETHWQHQDGSILDVLLSSTPLDPNDLSAGVTFTALDITERKRAEVALRDERDRTQKYFQLAGVMLIAIAKDHKVSLINKKGCDILGYEEAEIVGKNWFDHFLPERIREEVKSVFDALMNGNIEPSEFYENQVVNKSGKERIIAWHNTVLTDECGSPIASFSSGEDITERKLVEKERDRLFNLSLDMLCIVGFDGYFKQVNPAWNRILGWTEDELLSKPWIEFVHPDDRGATASVGQRLAAGEPVYFFENRCRCKDESYRWISWNALPLPDEELILAVVHDSTDQRKLESQLRQAQKMEAIGTLAGGIAHDFNNILSAILGYSEILTLFYIEKDNPARSNLEEILKAANRAKDLVKQILTFSRQTEQEKRPVLLTPIIKEAVKFLRSSLPTTIDIRQNLLCKEDSVLADPTQMHQVVMNLCTNAAHAMKERSGVLEIKLEEVELKSTASERFLDLVPGPYLQLTVADNGHGMVRDVLERIFEPYFTTKKQGEGTGLGLAVVHGIVSNHGGVIEVASEVDRGTTFQVLLPRLKREVTTTAEKADRALPKGNECILFIDDEETVVDVGKRILHNLGYDVLGVTDPSAALETFRLQPDRFDLVITDLTMPHMTGLQLAEQLTLIKPDIPIILCTGLGDKNTKKEAKIKGIKKFVHKPISVYKLAETVREVLNERL
jgi:PAS domain S-box-containing protein